MFIQRPADHAHHGDGENRVYESIIEKTGENKLWQRGGNRWHAHKQSDRKEGGSLGAAYKLPRVPGIAKKENAKKAESYIAHSTNGGQRQAVKGTADAKGFGAIRVETLVELRSRHSKAIAEPPVVDVFMTRSPNVRPELTPPFSGTFCILDCFVVPIPRHE